mmetsp:Transcript_3815/g.13735  ORF Transcript_3815/g.13735 Transcript_3815/m.13735 type:complete len:232 (+) Transcript_3815:3261-3956(+)
MTCGKMCVKPALRKIPPENAFINPSASSTALVSTLARTVGAMPPTKASARIAPPMAHLNPIYLLAPVDSDVDAVDVDVSNSHSSSAAHRRIPAHPFANSAADNSPSLLASALANTCVGVNVTASSCPCACASDAPYSVRSCNVSNIASISSTLNDPLLSVSNVDTNVALVVAANSAGVVSDAYAPKTTPPPNVARGAVVDDTATAHIAHIATFPSENVPNIVVSAPLRRRS